MAEIMRINMDLATNDPEAVFESPENLVDHIALTRGQKLAALKKWSFAVKARLDALSEGMRAAPLETDLRDVALLQRISTSIATASAPLPTPG